MTTESVRDEDPATLPAVVALGKVVAKLRADNERLERQASTTAVLERAKGVLMARSGCSAPAAYEELTRRAAAGSRTLTEECWIVLGEIHQRPTVPAAREDERPPVTTDAPGGGSVFDSTRGTRRAATDVPSPPSRPNPPNPSNPSPPLNASNPSNPPETITLGALGEALAGVTDPHDLAWRLLDHLAAAPVQADAVMLYTRTGDSALELSGHAGVGATVATQWRHVPPVAGVAALDVIRRGEPVWLEDHQHDIEHYHLIGEPASRWPTRAWLPVVTGGTVTAALGVLRTTDAPFEPAVRELLRQVAPLCAGSLSMIGASRARTDDRTDRTAQRVQAVFDALPGAAVLLTPLRSAAGQVEDFRVDAAAPGSVDVAGRQGRQLVGARLLECYPTVAGSSVWNGYLDTLRTGVVFETGSFPYQEVTAGVRQHSTYRLRAAKLDDRLVITWACEDEADRQRQLLADLQRVGNLGWADWNLAADTVTWSPQVYDILDRDRSLGPMSLEELPSRLLPEDLPAFARELRELLGRGTPLDHPFRIRTAAGVRHLRMVAEVVPDADGTPVEVHGFVQDLTARRRAELALTESQQAVQAQRNVLEAERTVAARLQHALLPLPGQSLNLADLRVDVAYLPSHDDLNVGGDWYSALEMPDGSVLFAVGDVAGHGIDAVATMAQLRFTAKGMVFTGSSLTGALHRLNTLLLHAHDGHHSTATMVLGRYDPARRCLTWAQAGHPPPLLVRQGKTDYLAPPEGMLLGATPQPHYGEAECRIEPGDHLLLYTDGLIERPCEHLDEGFDRFAEAARRELGEADDGSLQPLLDRLLSGRQRDDVCLLDVHLPLEGEGQEGEGRS
ncbi:SpoIIE family protein phosphatase [Streptomyces abikoensis]|uniref:SpoIIE family protein phosphatase n=1 Tax=Streptomyces abikoensis TaxID=97398 RepID=UPI001E351AD8|nr:SpoIIE family protein phosphatase [Streptomyces abikoensis]